MKKIIRLINVLWITVIFLFIFCVKVNGKNEINNNPYETYTIGLNNELVASPLAYEGVFVLNPGFKNPEDIYIDKNDNVYICDSGNKIVYKYNITTQSFTKIGEGILQGPTGVCLDQNDNIYIADYDGRCVVKFDNNGNELKRFERPIEALFGEESQYLPQKVVVDKIGNLFITSEGNANGIIQLNENGEFMGYFGPNNVKLTVSLFLKRLILSKEDRETYASLSPKVTTNLTIDEKNIIYTTIDEEEGVSLKKYNVSGTNVLNKTGFYSSSYQDITVDSQGFIYTVDKSANGVVQVMDQEGNLIFQFGSTIVKGYQMGEFMNARGIAVDSKGNIWVLDYSGKNIQVFIKTAFCEVVFNAIKSYNNGDYEGASFYYQEILKQNASFVASYVGLGKINQRLQNYDEALEYFKIANYKSGYSEVFWELRDEWLNRNLLWIIITVLVLLIIKIFKIGKLLKIKEKISIKGFIEKIKNSKFMNEIKYVWLVLRKPKDTFYDVKYHLTVKTRTSLILFILFILINIFGDYFIRGYLFRIGTVENINFAFELLKWGLIIIIFVVGNSLVSSLQNGEGFFRDIFICAMLAFSPILLFKIPVDIISNFLTYNEGYIYTILNSFLWIWSFFNLLLMIKEIHNYSVKELILNIFLTIIAVIILVLLYLILYILAMQFIDFFVGLIKEGGARS